MATGRLFASGGLVPVALEPRERVVFPPISQAHMGVLVQANQQYPRFAGGGFTVPGSGSGDTFHTWVPSGSFIVNRHAAGAMGYQGGGTTGGNGPPPPPSRPPCA